MRRLSLALLCVSLPLAAQAQQRDTIVVRAQLPRDVAVEVVSLFNATTTMRTTIGPIRENAQTRAFLLDLMREVVAPQLADVYPQFAKEVFGVTPQPLSASS